jgi:hypothetical protein
MTIDERLEALTRSLELLASIVAENEKRQTLAETALNERFSLLAQVLLRHDERLDRLEGR